MDLLDWVSVYALLICLVTILTWAGRTVYDLYRYGKLDELVPIRNKLHRMGLYETNEFVVKSKVSKWE